MLGYDQPGLTKRLDSLMMKERTPAFRNTSLTSDFWAEMKKNVEKNESYQQTDPLGNLKILGIRIRLFSRYTPNFQIGISDFQISFFLSTTCSLALTFTRVAFCPQNSKCLNRSVTGGLSCLVRLGSFTKLEQYFALQTSANNSSD